MCNVYVKPHKLNGNIIKLAEILLWWTQTEIEIEIEIEIETEIEIEIEIDD